MNEVSIYFVQKTEYKGQKAKYIGDCYKTMYSDNTVLRFFCTKK